MALSKTANNLIGNAGASGNLSAAAEKVIINIPDIGEQINNALGITADDVTASEVTLVTELIDDSGSIRMAGNTQVVRDGHNLVVGSLAGTKQKDSIIMHVKYLNGEVLFPYLPIDQAVRMDSGNYNPNGGTPLYDQMVVILGSVLAKAQEFEDNGIAVRTVTLVVTDGADCGSRSADAADVKKVVRDMLKKEKHIIAGMGIDDAPKKCPDCGADLSTKFYINCPSCNWKVSRTDFKQVFRDMGLEDEWILTPGNTESEIRQAFGMFSQSAVRASQGAGSFSKTAGGGFGTP